MARKIQISKEAQAKLDAIYNIKPIRIRERVQINGVWKTIEK